MRQVDRQDYERLKENFVKCRPFYEAIGDPTRSAIIIELIVAGEQGLRVGELQNVVHLSRPAISHHLRILKDAGIVHLREEGTLNYYYLCIKDHLPQLMTASNDLGCFLKKYYTEIDF